MSMFEFCGDTKSEESQKESQKEEKTVTDWSWPIMFKFQINVRDTQTP